MKYLELTIASFAVLVAAILPSAAKVVRANDVAAQQRTYCGADQSCINVLIDIDAGCMGDYDRIHGLLGAPNGITYLDTECVKDAIAVLPSQRPTPVYVVPPETPEQKFAGFLGRAANSIALGAAVANSFKPAPPTVIVSPTPMMQVPQPNAMDAAALATLAARHF